MENDSVLGLLNSTKCLILVIMLYFFYMLAVRYSGWYIDDYVFFIEPGREVYKGTLQIYKQKLFPQIAPPLGIGYTYPPLVAILISPFIALGDFLRFSDDLIGKYLFPIPLMIFDVLYLFIFLKLLRLIRPDIPPKTQMIILILVLCIPGFASSSAFFTHAEAVLCTFLLFGFYYYFKSQWIRSAFFFSLALLTKQTAIFAVTPILIVRLKQTIENKNYDQASRFVATLFVPFLVIFLPFILIDYRNAYYNLVKGQQLLVISGETIWFVLNELSRLFAKGDYEAVNLWIRSFSQLILIGIMLLLTSFLVLKNAIHSRKDLLALVIISLLLIEILSKWTGVFYKIMPFTMLIIWELIDNKKDIPLLSIIFIVILSLFDSLPIGVHFSRYDPLSHLLRAMIKIPLYLGLIYYLIYRIIYEKGKHA